MQDPVKDYYEGLLEKHNVEGAEVEIVDEETSTRFFSYVYQEMEKVVEENRRKSEESQMELSKTLLSR
jgi:hypothetical protein